MCVYIYTLSTNDGNNTWQTISHIFSICGYVWNMHQNTCLSFNPRMASGFSTALYTAFQCSAWLATGVYKVVPSQLKVDWNPTNYSCIMLYLPFTSINPNNKNVQTNSASGATLLSNFLGLVFPLCSFWHPSSQKTSPLGPWLYRKVDPWLINHSPGLFDWGGTTQKRDESW